MGRHSRGRSKVKIERLHGLIETIKKSASDASHWFVSTDDLISHLGVSQTRFYQALYELQGKIYFSDALDAFTPENAGDFVTVLENFFGDLTEQTLTRAGLFLPHHYRIELMECFFSSVHDFLGRHAIQYEEFEAILNRTIEFNQVFEVYLRKYILIASLIESAFVLFNETKGLDSFAYNLSKSYIESLFERHILSVRGVFAFLEHRLKAYVEKQTARHRYHEQEWRYEPQGRSAILDIEGAYKTMELDGERITKTILRKRYKELMKLFHPDINPSGLEKCKQINSAYALLLPFIE